MIDSISSSFSSNYEPSHNRSSSNSLSYEQQQVVQDVLSNYDSSFLSTNDAQEIVSAFQDAGITPSKSLADAMDSLGFDAAQLGALAGVGPANGHMPPPPPPPKGDEVSSISDVLSELLDWDDDDDDNSSSSNNNSNSYGSDSSVNSFETVLDYTSRILSLNDEAKDKVMDLFEQYSPENTELSSKDVSTIIKSSLQDILSDSNNYNSTSFYA